MPRRGIKRTNNSNSYSNTSDYTAFDVSVEKKPSKKKSKQRNKNKSSNVNKCEHKTEHLNGSVDNVNLMSNFNQPRYVNDTNLMYSQNPSPMFQMQNQSQHLCSTPNPGIMSFPLHQVHHTSPLAQQIPDQRPGWVDELFRKMDKFEIKLCKLDQIDSLVTSINSKVIKLEQNAKSIDDRMDQFLCNGIIVGKELNDGIILLKLYHNFFATDKDIFICFSYVPHERFNYYQLCDIDFHDIIESIVNNYNDVGIVMVRGDLNSRIGELSDFLLSDDLDKYVESVEHVVNPIISDRRSMDKTVNAFGRKLLQMCFNTGLVVANGRLCNDKDGNFTFCTAKGRSVNDYLLVPRANVD
ncbi:unnamed protein product [Mytilus coruscus]|uniref:Endonuclease/exonuclease/phosphatase domain-containing protein n=1 Tax=Mytilus coruscus TaxID=42192 RepID=A0A6J8DBE9_MYTCO|nr:unnamed protein product [Mytilus coruscus]